MKEKRQSLQALLARWGEAVAGTAEAQPPAYAGPDVLLVNLVEHTNDVVEGSCFVARVRQGSDGHPYIGQALARGAAVIIGERSAAELGVEFPVDVPYLQVADSAVAVAWLAAAWHRFPSRHLTIVGITGTDGKTSTTNLLFEILRAAGLKAGMISTIKAVIGETEEPTGLHVSTPEAPAVQGYLQRMVEAGMTHCLLETTSHGLAQHRVTAVNFDVAIVTNITHEHLDYHGSYEGYFAAKARLFEMAVSAGAQGRKGVGVLNRDDSSYTGLAALVEERALTYGIRLPADVMAETIEFTPAGTSFILTQTQTPRSKIQIKSPLTGLFNVYNMLAAATAALALNIPLEAIKAGIEAVDLISGRMQRIDEGQKFQVIVDFAHTPNALEKAIEAARPLVKGNGRIIAVFGSAGKRDIEKRRLMAEISAQAADVTVLTAEDPRTEPLEDILEMMAAGCRRFGGVEGETFWRVPDRGEAIYFALTLARSQDLVLICGKGHEQSMCFGTTEYEWDDREATRAALAAFLQGKPAPDLGLPTFGRGKPQLLR